MTRPRKKIEELRRFELFRSRTGFLPGLVTQPEPPEPDICIQTPSGRVAVELTELVTSRAERARESEQDEIISRAQLVYESMTSVRVAANFYWKAGSVPKDRAETGYEIAQLLSRHVPALGRDIILDLSPDATERLDHPLFDRIWIDRIIDYDENIWYSPRAWWVPTLQPDTIQIQFDRKSTKPASYREAYSQHWLLITSDGGAPSSSFQVAPQVFTHTYSGRFHRAFLAVFALGSIHELPLATSEPDARGLTCA